jgi:hypothetical protein
MSKQVKLRRGTTSEHATFTGALGEVTVDTTKDVAIVHDGTTAGGTPMAREDRPRGWVKTEVFSTPLAPLAAQWTQTGKTDLKRIRVTAYGGGGGGGSAGNAASGGGAGGIGIVTLEASAVSTNVSITIGPGGAVMTNGTSTSFGPYITATGGTAGVAGAQPDSGTSFPGGAGGTATGTGVLVLGGAGGASGFGVGWGGTVQYPGYPSPSNWGTGQGGGLGGGAGKLNANGTAGVGITGGGGGGGAAGAQGCVIVEEIYGLY